LEGLGEAVDISVRATVLQKTRTETRQCHRFYKKNPTILSKKAVLWATTPDNGKKIQKPERSELAKQSYNPVKKQNLNTQQCNTFLYSIRFFGNIVVGS
jgi:hypothetical protein